MDLDRDACYAALSARDPRFDGLFLVGVRSTGVYCRPVCPARLPRLESCTFFRLAAEAERAGYRACLRCRPELAPGHASVDARSKLARSALARIDDGFLDGSTVPELADELGVSARHLRRVLESELGVSPVELAQTRRLAIAKHLLQDSDLPVTRVAYASGFASLRRFNALFRERFARPPSALRGRASANGARAASRAAITLRLDYRPPLAWSSMLAFLAARATLGVEDVGGGAYRRWVVIGPDAGWVHVRQVGDRPRLRVSLPHTLVKHVSVVVAGLRRLLDLDARPDLIEGHLRADARLAPLVDARPGLRVPGAFDPFELAVRAVLGQQISVAAATALCGRLVEAVASERPGSGRDPHAPDRAHRGSSGPDDSADPHELGPGVAFPSPDELASWEPDALRTVGMPRSRARAVVELSRAVRDGRVELDPDGDPELISSALRALPGIGPWTAEYILMRALRWPNAFPASDLGLRRALGTKTAAATRERARRWEPWRAYAAMHLWNELGLEES